MSAFFQEGFRQLVDSPNQSPFWWHSLPLPDGNRINGRNVDKDLQMKMWRAMGIGNERGLAGKRVLDIGANDGFFTLAALMAGAEQVTAMDSDWSTWPRNIEWISRAWGVNPTIITADFRRFEFEERYDVIFFLGVLYHLEDVFGCMKTLRRLLRDNGAIYLETQMTQVNSDLPIFEYASDIFSTVAPQDKKNLGAVGISNFLFPNEPAIFNLAHSYDLECHSLEGPHNRYTQENPLRRMYRLNARAKAG